MLSKLSDELSICAASGIGRFMVGSFLFDVSGLTHLSLRQIGDLQDDVEIRWTYMPHNAEFSDEYHCKSSKSKKDDLYIENHRSFEKVSCGTRSLQ
ncbi:hypothetical protein BROC_02103 [Candidatus Brocadiaceae bacterium]|nr:hypothetical protein BROC_02103 [Candidatus Brocadiaceae bacterium]